MSGEMVPSMSSSVRGAAVRDHAAEQWSWQSYQCHSLPTPLIPKAPEEEGKRQEQGKEERRGRRRKREGGRRGIK